MAEGILPFQELDLGKKQLVERCRELEFIDDVQDLKCTSCNILALEHWYTNCGHALCPNCKRLLSGGGIKCPQCGQLIQYIKEQSVDFEEKVNGLQVKCLNRRYGCPLVTTVKELQEHLVNCEWAKEHTMPTVHGGSNTTQILLEEVSKMKMQIGDMHGTIGFLLRELYRRQEVDDIKKRVEMSVADIKSCLNDLSSGLDFETNTSKAQTKNFNFKQLQTYFSSKEKVKQQEEQLTKLDGKTNAQFQMLDEKLDKFSQRLMKEIENIYAKIKTGEDKMKVMQIEDKICMEKFHNKQMTAFENYKQEFLANSKDSQGKVEKSNYDFKMELHKLGSELTLELKQQELSFNQNLSLEVKQLEEKILKNKLQLDEEWKENAVKMEAMISELKKQDVVLMKQFQDERKDFVLKEKLKQLQNIVDEMNDNNKLLIQMLDQKEEKFSQKLTRVVEAMDAKSVTSEGRLEAALINCRKETATISNKLQSIDEIKQQLTEVKSDMTQGLKQEQLQCNQKLSHEIKALEEKIKSKDEEIDKKMNSLFEKQEVAVENCRKEMATFSDEITSKILLSQQEVARQRKGSEEISTEEFNNHPKQIPHDIEKETKQLYEEIDQLNKKKDNLTKVETIQQLIPHINSIEAVERVIAIEQYVNRKPSIQQLVDGFLFGSAEEQMVIELLCLKWTFKHIDSLIPVQGRNEHMSDVFPVYGYELKAQLGLAIYSGGDIRLIICLKDEERKGQKVEIKPMPMVTYFIKVFNGQNKHFITYQYYSSNSLLDYNEFGYFTEPISKSQWNALICPHDKSMEVLALVEPPAISNKLLSTDGTMTDTIQHYSKKLQMEKEGLLIGHWSPSFLTHASGFRVSVQLSLNWTIDNDKKGLLARIRFLPKKFDSRMGTGFVHETSVTLINHLDARVNMTAKKQAREATYYEMEIASEDAINSGGFLVNDSLTYHITIKPFKPSSTKPIFGFNSQF